MLASRGTSEGLRAPCSKSARSVPTVCRASPDDSQAVTTMPKYTNVGPEPRRFVMEPGQIIAVAANAWQPIMRLGAGMTCVGYNAGLPKDDGTYAVVKGMGRKFAETSTVASYPRPAKPLELYEFQGCPFCKKVREAVSMLDLDVMLYPCPTGGDLWRPKAIANGGKKQFPYLKDPNTGVSMYESDDIIRYLFKTYGPGEDQVPRLLTLGFFTTLTAGLGLAPRLGKGSRSVPSKQPAQPLVLWAYEGSPFCTVVREVLCEMQLPYLYRNVARGSPRRQQLLDKYGHFQVPLLEDPNTESYMFESAAIIRYLRHQYAKEE